MVHALGLAFVLAFVEDRPDCLLTGGVVCGNTEQVVGGIGLQAAKHMDQGLIGCPREECADDVRINDIRKRVAPLQEPTDVIPQGLIGLLLAALEVLGIPRIDIGPLKISNEDPLEIHLVADAIGRNQFESCSNMLPHADGEVLDDEVVIIHSSSSIGEPEVFKPYTRIRFPGVFGDVGRWSEGLWEWCFLDATAKGPWS